MAVAGSLGESHVVWDTKSLPSLVGGLHAAESGLGAQPVNGVLNDVHGTGRDEGSKHVVVVGKVVD